MAAIAEGTDARLKLPRVGVLDTARGVALLAMASYHFSWDLEHFGYLAAGAAETGWLKIYARTIASTFLFLAGVSLVLASSPEVRWPSYFKRLGMIVIAALAISAVTFVMMPEEWIFFGILHSIAAASVIGLLFLRLPAFATLITAAILFAGILVENVFSPGLLRSSVFDAPWLWWLGLSETLPRSNDYVPLFPWLTPFLFGLGTAQLGMTAGWFGRLAALGTGNSLAARAGRHSLLFYLVHQPVLFGSVYLLSLIFPAPAPDPAVGYLNACQVSCTKSGTEALCRSFCQCTLDQLKAHSLLEPLQAGTIKADNDEQIQRIAIQCTIQAQ